MICFLFVVFISLFKFKKSIYSKLQINNNTKNLYFLKNNIIMITNYIQFKKFIYQIYNIYLEKKVKNVLNFKIIRKRKGEIEIFL